jgi:enoyl-CoA hydratase
VTAPSEPDTVRLEREGPIALLTLDHPPVNVLSAAVLDRLSERLREAEADAATRAVVLASAAEKAFAAGANIREMAPMGFEQARVHGGRGQQTTLTIERLSIPVIAAVHGSCLGGGCELALACDLVVASEDAVFGQPEINLGVMPGWGGTQRLADAIGPRRAREWIYLGKPHPAAEAHAAGWLYKVVPRAELLGAAKALARELASKPATALAAAKFALQRATLAALDEGLAFELDLWARLFETVDQKEGMKAFLEKRPFTAEKMAKRGGAKLGFPWEGSEERSTSADR